MTAVRVLDLGAFLVFKGAVFPRRPDDSRKSKDLLYIVEVMSAGNHVESFVESRIRSLANMLGPDLRTATNNLRLLLTPGSALSRLLLVVSEAVAEIDGSTFSAAEGKTIGHVTDFMHMISELADD